MDDFEKSFQRIRKIAKKKNWPGVEEGESWGTPSLKVKGKMLLRVREPGVLVIMCPVEAKEVLLVVAPHIYFELPHYKGYPAILARMDAIEDDEIAEMVEEYWRKVAPKKLVEEFDSHPTDSPTRKDSKKAKARAEKKDAPKKTQKANAKTLKPKTKTLKPTVKSLKKSPKKSNLKATR